MDVNDEALFQKWEKKNCNTQMDIDLDYAIAMSLQKEFNEEIKENANTNSEKHEASKPLSIVDEQWELIDPHPDIHALFVEYDERFFYGKLKSVEVRWSPRMTLCAGVCSYQGKGGLCSVRLSEPLLKLRPRRDLVETLLHEMIHAYLFVTENNRDRDGHGPEFLSHMYRINRETGTNITVYHSFHDEVNLYKKHWWKCDGPCSNRAPYFGFVKRVMNRAPGPNDNWWAAHQLSCGGKFVKVKEPSNFKEKKVPKRKLQSDPKGKSSDIRKFIKSNDQESKKGLEQLNILGIGSHALDFQKKSFPNKDSFSITSAIDMPKGKNFIPFQGSGHKLGIASTVSQVSLNLSSIHVKDSDFENRTDFPPSSSKNSDCNKTSIFPEKVLMKKVETCSSIGKTLSLRDLFSSSGKSSSKRNTHTPKKTRTIEELFSNSCRKETVEKDLSSNLSRKFKTDIPIPRSAEVQRMSNASDVRDLQSGLSINSVASSSNTNKSEKSAVENIFSSQNRPDYPKESYVIGVNFPSDVSTKLYCPVCSNLVNEEINAHLDKCLKNSTV